MGYLKLKTENEALRRENEELKARLKREQRLAKQWDNLFSYTGKPQKEAGDDQD